MTSKQETLIIIAAVWEGKNLNQNDDFFATHFPTPKCHDLPSLAHVAKAPVFTTHAFKIYLIISVMLRD